MRQWNVEIVTKSQSDSSAFRFEECWCYGYTLFQICLEIILPDPWLYLPICHPYDRNFMILNWWHDRLERIYLLESLFGNELNKGKCPTYMCCLKLLSFTAISVTDIRICTLECRHKIYLSYYYFLKYVQSHKVLWYPGEKMLNYFLP